MLKNLPANTGDIRDVGSIPGSGRPPGGGHDNPFQFSYLENPCGQRRLVGYSPSQGKRNPSKMVDVARGHQRADTLKP